jgi:hypothetical protein
MLLGILLAILSWVCFYGAVSSDTDIIITTILVLTGGVLLWAAIV